MADVYSANKYLDLTTLGYYDGKIKAWVAAQIQDAEYELPIADAETLGGVKIGGNVDVTAEGVISVKTASDAQLGLAQAGANIDVASGVFSVKTATASDLGVAKAGTNVTAVNGAFNVATATGDALGVAQAGTNIDVSNGVFSVKTASGTDLGVAKAGTNITAAEGTFNVATATASGLGVAQAGTNIDVADGVFSVKTASDAQLGLAQAGTNIDVANGVFSVKNASATDAGVMSAADYAKLAAFGDASTYALKSDIVNAYIYKGTVATVDALPSENQTAGDVYNVTENGMNYAWTGTAWDALGSVFEVTTITTSEIDALFA